MDYPLKQLSNIPMTFNKKPTNTDSDEEQVDSSDFENLLKESLSKPERRLSVGEKINAEVLSVGKENIIVATGTRNDGFVSSNLLRDEQGKSKVKVGDKIDLFVTFIRGSEIHLSPGGGTQSLAAGIEEAYASGMAVPGKVESVNKGGFQVLVFGKAAFCPMGQMDVKRIDKPEEYIGKKFEFKISQITEGGRNVVISRRKILEEGQGAALAGFKEQRKVGDTVKGKITRIEPFGAFIEIAPGLEGLAHISELSWSRVNNPKDILTIGQDVSARILRIEQEERRLKISLTLKQADQEPWLNLASHIQTGRVVGGRVTRCMDFGAFVELQPGIEGLIPLSEMSSTKRANRADEFVKVGEEVSVMIKNVDLSAKRVSLSLKDAANGAASMSESEDIKDYAKTQAARESVGAQGDLAAKMQAALAKKQKSSS
jgi:small subunit ribosomal protein S1